MSNERRERKPNNLGFIFEQLHRGVPSVEILSQIEERRRRRAEGSKAAQKGSHSERVARNAIFKIPVVASAIISPKDGYEDENLVDINVRLKIPDVEQVAVQVKSSQEGIKKAKRILRRKMKLTVEQFDEWLIANKLILMNGQQDNEEIQQQFMDQLDKIKEFHAVPQKPIASNITSGVV
mgnify:FL=1